MSQLWPQTVLEDSDSHSDDMMRKTGGGGGGLLVSWIPGLSNLYARGLYETSSLSRQHLYRWAPISEI